MEVLRFMKKMKAAVLIKPRQFEIKEVPVPEIKETDVLVKIKATAICGTEVPVYTGEHPGNYPVIMGHETAGIIIKTGPAVTSVKSGDPVFVISGISCGLCKYCRQGKDNLCPNGGLLGRELQGSFAEYLAVPERAVFKLPENFTIQHATTLNLLMTIIHGHKRSGGIFPGQSVAIIGLGPAGLAQILFVKQYGACPIVGIGHREWRAEIAKKFGADKVFIMRDGESIEEIKKFVGGEGYDVVITSAGRPSAVWHAIELVKPGGLFLQFGITGEVDKVDFYKLYFKEVNIINTRATTGADFEQALKVFLKKEEMFKQLITNTLPLERIQEGFEMARDRSKVGVLRIVIT